MLGSSKSPPLIRVSLLGPSGAGKTTYLASLYESLTSGSQGGFYLAPTSIKLVDVLSEQSDLARLAFDRDRPAFPSNTSALDAVSRFRTAELRNNDRVIASVSLHDYRGGLIDDIYTAGAIQRPLSSPSLTTLPRSAEQRSQEFRYKEFTGWTERLSASDAILVFIDSVMLWKERNDLKRARQFSGLSSSLRVLQSLGTRSFVQRSHRLSIVLLLAKADSELIPETEQTSGLLDLGIDAASELIALVKSRGWKAGIVPVGSIGRGRLSSVMIAPENAFAKPTVTAEITDIPSPENVTDAFFFAMLSSLEVDPPSPETQEVDGGGLGRLSKGLFRRPDARQQVPKDFLALLSQHCRSVREL